ncbi:ABC transporter ATP-binding protein [Thiocystis violacea]|uniref:ATP-binding cassette domain-containing protein n=1 Tax=Thiocystis violacea TaxID=13725 RepID=UPI001904D85E|nr:ABC transporter ATP-binding protein [Thiocystis violacea]MBK1718879.1 ABC transporter [Thiocystis violacea]
MIGPAETQPTAEALRLERVYQHVNGRMALNDIHLDLAQGDWLLIVGPNGAGKSLLVRLLLGLDAPSAGRIQVLGQDLGRLDGAGLGPWRRQVGAVLQGGSLLASASVLENLLLPLRERPMSRADMARAARLVMTLLKLDGLENHRPRALSLGQRRQVELARALVHQPRLLVWDGFSDGLDPAAIREILDVLGGLREHRGLTLVATDNRAEILASARHRVVVLDRGRALFDGDPEDLKVETQARLDLRAALGVMA